MSAHKYVEEISLAAMLAAKRSAGVAPEVKLREHVTHTPLPSVNKADHSGFEAQKRCHQKSKTYVPPKLNFKKIKKRKIIKNMPV